MKINLLITSVIPFHHYHITRDVVTMGLPLILKISCCANSTENKEIENYIQQMTKMPMRMCSDEGIKII